MYKIINKFNGNFFFTNIAGLGLGLGLLLGLGFKSNLTLTIDCNICGKKCCLIT